MGRRLCCGGWQAGRQAGQAAPAVLWCHGSVTATPPPLHASPLLGHHGQAAVLQRPSPPPFRPCLSDEQIRAAPPSLPPTHIIIIIPAQFTMGDRGSCHLHGLAAQPIKLTHFGYMERCVFRRASGGWAPPPTPHKVMAVHRPGWCLLTGPAPLPPFPSFLGAATPETQRWKQYGTWGHVSRGCRAGGRGVRRCPPAWLPAPPRQPAEPRRLASLPQHQVSDQTDSSHLSCPCPPRR